MGDSSQLRRLLPWLSAVVVLGICGAAAHQVNGRWPRSSALPPLLIGANAGFGRWNGCGGSGDGVSPELDKRIRDEFPPGSSEADLVATLKDQRFGPPTPCQGNTSVRHSHFVQPKDAPIDANVYWRVDDANKIVWTHGFVFFVSL
jgi:hypothetical protein